MWTQSSVLERRPIYAAWIVFFASFALKLFYFMALDNPQPYAGDSFYYFQYAINLNEYGVFSKDRIAPPTPDSYWAPGYPFFLYLCLKFSDLLNIYFYPVVMLAQAVLASMTVVLTFLTGRFLLSSPYAILVALLTLFSPHLMVLGGDVLSETLFGFLLSAGVYVYIVRVCQTQSIVWALLGGLIWGAAYLTNPVILFAPIFIMLMAIFANRRVTGKFTLHANISTFIIIFFIVVFGWALRDLISVPKTQLASSDRAFENLIIGSHSNFHKMWRDNPRDPMNPADQDMKIYREDHAGFYRELSTRIASNPLHFAEWYFIRKPLDLWGWRIFVGWGGGGGIFISAPNSTLYDKSTVASISLAIMRNIHYWLFSLALLGFIFALKESSLSNKESILILYITLISISAVYVVLHADARYSVPMRPEMYLCAVYAIYKIIEKFKAWRMRS